MSTSIDNPILNSPYKQPDRHYAIGPQGPTGEVKDGRRPSEFFVPIAVSKKGKKGGRGNAQRAPVGDPGARCALSRPPNFTSCFNYGTVA